MAKDYTIRIRGFTGELSTRDKLLAETMLNAVSAAFPGKVTMMDYDLPEPPSAEELERQARGGYFVQLMEQGYRPSVAAKAAFGDKK